MQSQHRNPGYPVTSKIRQKAYLVATLVALICSIVLPMMAPGFAAPTASAHNLQTNMVGMFFDKVTQDMLDTRIAGNGPEIPQYGGPPEPLLRVGDKLGIVIKVVPRANETATGVGGYVDFYVPNGVTVIDAGYVVPDGSGGYDPIPMKGQSLIALGDGPIGAKTKAEMIGLTLGPNLNGATEPVVTAAGLMRGTIAGVYGDTGIFYSTHPDTAWNTWVSSGGYDQNTGTSDNTLTNNSGDVITPLNKWDGEQMLAWGAKSPIVAIVDTPDQRGNAPWGLASGVAGPQSGYAWDFDWDYWRSSAKTASDMREASNQMGPWQRIQQPGARISKDQPGLASTTLGIASVDASTIGFDLNPANPLPSTTSQTDGTSPKTVRWSIGQTTRSTPEYVWVQVRVDTPSSAFLDPSGCPVFKAGTFGGDAGGDSNGKDHLWRYYEPSTTTWNGCLALGKPSNRVAVKVGDTFQYRVKFYNLSAFTYSNVIVQDTLPSGVQFISAVPAQSSGPNPLRWVVGTMLPGQKFESIVTVKATGSGDLTNTVCVDSDQIDTCADDITPGGNLPYLVQNKSVNTPNIAPGANVQYTVLIDNIGTGATGTPVTVSEYLPPGFTYVSKDSVTVNGANLTASTTVNTSNLNAPIFTVPSAINAGQKLLLVFTAQASPNSVAGSYCNSYTTTQNDIPLTTGGLACVNVGAGTIGDTVFRDWNGNSTQDAEDEGLPGVTVNLYAGACPPSGGVIQNRVTDASGKYLFSGLNTPASYCVDPVAPAGYTSTTPPEPRTITLAQNETNLTADFGFRPGGVGSIGDKVFEDLANDGLFNGSDVGIDGVTINLYEDTNGNGVIDAGQDALFASTTSSGGGNYAFTNLDPTRWYIVDPVDGAGSAVDSHFANPYNPSTANPNSVSPADFTAQSNAVTDADFGYFGQTPGSIGDTVCIDTNGNSLCDPGEQGIANVTVKLYNDTDGDGSPDAGELVISTSTSITGYYKLEDLGPGNFIVVVDQSDTDIPNGYFSSISQHNVVLAVAQNVTTADFPFIQVLSKAVNAATANPGDVLFYTITANYPGPQLLTEVVISDTIPDGTAYVPNSVNAAGRYSSTIDALEWQLGSNAEAIPGLTSSLGTALCPVITTLSPTADTWIDMDNPAKNNGGNTLLLTRPAASDKLKYSLVRFDASSIPAGALIQSALLGMNVQTNRSSNHFDQVYRMKTAWAEGTGSNDTCGVANGNGATWNAPNCTNSWSSGAFSSADFDGTLLGTIKPSTKSYKTAQVKNAVDAWVNGGAANNGLVLVSTGTDGGDAKYYNRENTTVNTDPYLKVTYFVETVGGCSGPTLLEPVADTFVNEDNDTQVNGTATTLTTRPEATKRKHGLVQFDLAAIPPDAIITSATLSVTVNSKRDANHDDQVRRLNTPWTEADASWSDPNATASGDWQGAGGVFGTADYGTTVYGTIQPDVNDAVKTVNVTALVQDWVNNGVSNYGLTLLSTGTDNGDARYFTREATGGDAGSRPKLYVAWTLPPNPAGRTRVNLHSQPLLLGQSGQIRIVMEVTSTNTISVTPPNELNGTLGSEFAGGASSLASFSKASGPSPAGPVVVSPGSPVYFTYLYNVTPGSFPGTITFSGKPSAAGAQFATGFSEAAISSPPLTYRVTIDGPPATVPFVVNTARMEDAGPLVQGVTSPPVVTSLSASIGDRVWADLDGQGDQDAGEPGVAGVQVCATPTAGGATTCATTDALGDYRIYGLTNGVSYDVTVTPATFPADYAPTTPTTLTRTATTAGVNDADFGLRPPGTASIGDTVWLDADEDGVLDAGESGLPNVPVHLYIDQNNDGAVDGGDLLVLSDVTDASGIYGFSGLHPDDYLVVVDTSAVVTTPFGLATTIGAALEPTTGTSNPRDVTITTAGQTITDADFGYNWGGSIGDRLWYDDNGNQQGPAGTPGGGESELYVADGGVLNLYYDSNGDGKVSPGEPIVAVALSDNAGYYLFDNLPPARYVVKAEEQQIPAPPSSANAGQIGRMVATTGSQHGVLLAGNQDYVAADFGFIEAAEVEGHVFHDVNNNGVLDSGEPRLPNVTVTLSGVDSLGNPVNLSVDTDGDGEYKFVVPPGNYTITYDSADIPAGLSYATTPTSININVPAGAEVSDLDFGVDNAGRIGDRIWYDSDGDGIQDASEPGLSGVTVLLYNSSGTTLLASTVSTATGGYLFPGLADGNYLVRVNTDSLPIGFGQTADPDEAGQCTTCDNESPAAVAGGGSNLTEDFGYRDGGGAGAGTVTLFGNVWYDTDKQGDFDEPTPASWIDGVKVNVSCSNGFSTQLTTAPVIGGNWSVDVPENSTCTVTVDTSTLPSTAYYQTGDPDEAGVCTVCNSTTVVTVGTQPPPSVDFGYVEERGSISGTVCDGSGDGICQGGETPIAGATLTLLYAPTLSDPFTQLGSPVTTGPSGLYSFTNLLPGYYQVIELNAPNYISLADVDGGNPDNISRMSAGAIPLAQGQDAIGRDFEDAPPPTGVLGDFVWNDLNKDGIQDGAEPGIAGVRMELFDLSNTLLQTTTTNASGYYSFTGLAAGSYIVSVAPQNFGIGKLLQFNLSPVGAGTVFTDSNGVLVTGAAIYTVTLGANVADLSIDFGFYAAGKSTIGDYVWYDDNADGEHNTAGELEYTGGIDGVVLYLYEDSNNNGIFEPDPTGGSGGDRLYAVTTTGDDPGTAGTQSGWYLFEAAGSRGYWVQAIPSNFAPGGPLENLQFTNGEGVTYQNANPQYVLLGASPAVDLDIDFGYAEIADLSITKTDNPDPVAPGGVLTYTLTYSNAGPSDATNVYITDTLPAGVTFGGVVSEAPAISGPTVSGQKLTWFIPTLAVSNTGTVEFTVTVGSGVSGIITNTVTITSTAYDPTPENNRDDEPTRVSNPSIAIAKTPDLQQVASGSTVTFTIRVTNTGDVTLNPVAVSDPNAPNCDRTNVGPLNPGQSVSYTCTRTNVTSDFTNVATATGTPPSGPPVTDQDDAVVDVIAPAIAIAKTPDLQTVVSGSTVTFTIRVTNTGDVTLNPVAVSDPNAPNCDRVNVGPLNPGQSISYTCTRANVTSDFTNVATATGTPPSGPPVTANDNALVDVIAPAIAIAKTPDLQTVVSGSTVTFTIRVTNTGDVALNPVVVSDPNAPLCNRANVGPLNPGQSTNYTCSLANVTADFTNVATATGTPPSGPPVTANDNAVVDVVRPAVTVQKTLLTPEPVRPGNPISFRIVVTNTGDIVITELPLQDTYNTTYLVYVNATPPSVDNLSDGTIDWSDLTVSFGNDLAPGASFTVVVNFTARADTTQLPGGVTINVGSVRNAVAGQTPVPDASDDAPVRIENPTGLLLGDSSLQASGSQVTVRWTTLSEANIAGFRVYRQINGGAQTLVSGQMIVAQKSGLTEGASYSFVDANSTFDAQHSYMLEVTLLSGGTVQADLGTILVSTPRLYLPVITR